MKIATIKFNIRYFAIVFIIIQQMSLSLPALAAPPQSLNYQGYLTDSSNLPINGPVNLTINIYNTDTGGNSLWTQSGPINITNGLFSTQLDGGLTNPFPANLFNGPLWIGISVASDPEMLPRTALTTAPYAMNSNTATESQTLAGIDGNVLVAIWEDFDFDGGAPANTDPSEGLTDVDNDGLANFMDSDNDNDGFSDSLELSVGSDINLITPNILNLSTDKVDAISGGNIDIFLDNPNNILNGQNLQILVDGVPYGSLQQITPATPTKDTHITTFINPAPVGTILNISVALGSESSTPPVQVEYILVKTVFLTNTTSNGNLGGVAGADAICQNSAINAGLTGTYKAWISDGPATQPATTFSQNTAGYSLVNSVIIATSWGDLTSGSIINPINTDEFGAIITSDLRAWTNVKTNGEFLNTTSTCDSWTGSSISAPTLGDATQVNKNWTDGPLLSCILQARLYCFEQ